MRATAYFNVDICTPESVNSVLTIEVQRAGDNGGKQTATPILDGPVLTYADPEFAKVSTSAGGAAGLVENRLQRRRGGRGCG